MDNFLSFVLELSWTIPYLVDVISVLYEIYVMEDQNQTKSKKRGPEMKPERLERFRVVRRKLAAVENRDITDVGLLDDIVVAFLETQETRFGIKIKEHEVHPVPNL